MANHALPKLRAGFETTGSTRWVMQAINNLGLDHKQGFELDLALHHQQGDTRKTSPEAALHAGEIDLIDTDWLSICRARAAGIRLTAGFPYGRIMGGLIAHDSSGISNLADLKGRRIGLLRETDKNWKVLRTWVRHNHGFDPADHCETTIIPAKLALETQLKDRQIDAAIIFWHRIPEILETPGLHEVCDLVDLVESLTGTSPATTFFVFREDFIKSHPQVVDGFRRAYCDAIYILSNNPTVWNSIVGLPSSSNSPDVKNSLFSRWKRRMVTQWSAEDREDLLRLDEQIAKIDDHPGIAPDRTWLPCVPADSLSNTVAMGVEL